MAASWCNRTLLLVTAMVGLTQPALAEAREVKRCGWYSNPTPANHWLTDKDASWTLMTQGGPAAPGWLDLPEQSFAFEGRWVEVNGSYGYGCACVTGRFGAASSGEVLKVTALTPLPLSRCEMDKSLLNP